MNRLKLPRSLKCIIEETQSHIFQSCWPILENLGLSEVPQLSQIYMEAIKNKNMKLKYLLKIMTERKNYFSSQGNLKKTSHLGEQMPGPKLFKL